VVVACWAEERRVEAGARRLIGIIGITGRIGPTVLTGITDHIGPTDPLAACDVAVEGDGFCKKGRLPMSPRTKSSGMPTRWDTAAGVGRPRATPGAGCESAVTDCNTI